eukprot:scaffold1235_cov25-Cyclotella_meneghiniana.AAC.1
MKSEKCDNDNWNFLNDVLTGWRARQGVTTIPVTQKVCTGSLFMAVMKLERQIKEIGWFRAMKQDHRRYHSVILALFQGC